MTHVSAVPIEAFDLVQHAPSIYGQCIYTQTIGVVWGEASVSWGASGYPNPRSAVRPERAFERNPHQLAAGPDPVLLEQLLQRRLDRAVANAELGANLLIGETL